VCMHNLRLLSSLTVLAATLACAADSPGPTEPAGPLFTAGKSPDPNPGVIWEFYAALSDATPAKITSDGAGAYQSGVCGVRGSIFVHLSESGDATFDPDADYKKSMSCARRYLNLELATGTVRSGPFTNARGVSYMAPGSTKEETMGWTVSLPNCERLRFNVTITRDDDGVIGPRTWVVQTKPHTGQCYVWSGGSYVANGVTHELPYRARVTEVPVS
jgi:opacity protein-like surface antigen